MSKKINIPETIRLLLFNKALPFIILVVLTIISGFWLSEKSGRERVYLDTITTFKCNSLVVEDIDFEGGTETYKCTLKGKEKE